MKLIEKSLNLPEQEYHDYPCWSHSMIFKYASKGFAAMETIMEHTAPTPSMEFGSMFDCMMTKGKQAFIDEYTVMEKVPAPAEKAMLDSMASCGFMMEDIDDATLITFANNFGYRMDLKKDETRIKKLRAESAYYNAKASGKKIISSQDYRDGLEMMKALRENPLTSSIFGRGVKDGVEYIYQAQFVTTIILGEDTPDEIGVEYKIMPDLMIIDHNERTIQLVDLKTSSNPAWDFAQNFLTFRYDLQAHSYSDVIGEVKKGTDEEDYTILPYLFVDISRSDKIPVTYVYDQLSSPSLSYTKYGNTYTYRSWKSLLKEMVDYRSTEAKVPSNISTDKPNDILSILSNADTLH